MLITLTDLQENIFTGKICPYCKSKTVASSEMEIYGRVYKDRDIIKCKNYPNCNSYVGCDSDGIPLGRLANKNLRRYKKLAHKYFDKIWKEKYLTRGECYRGLSKHFNIPPKYTHIGMFSVETCKEVIIWSKLKYTNYAHKS